MMLVKKAKYTIVEGGGGEAVPCFPEIDPSSSQTKHASFMQVPGEVRMRQSP